MKNYKYFKKECENIEKATNYKNFNNIIRNNFISYCNFCL